MFEFIVHEKCVSKREKNIGLEKLQHKCINRFILIISENVAFTSRLFDLYTLYSHVATSLFQIHFPFSLSVIRMECARFFYIRESEKKKNNLVWPDLSVTRIYFKLAKNVYF